MGVEVLGELVRVVAAAEGEAAVAVLTIGALVCIAAAIAGDTSQDLKSGFLIGATPRKQQIGEVIGVLRDRGDMAIVLVEQFFDFAHRLGDRFLVLERGTVKMSGRADEMERDALLAAVSV